MMTNADITILNKWYDSSERQEVFLPTIIHGVSFYMKSGSGGDNRYPTKTATYNIRIPVDADMGESLYTDLVSYKQMAKEEAGKHWTLQPESVIVPGIMDEADIVNGIDLTELEKKYGFYITVKDFSDNTTRGSERMKHWRIGGE